MKMHISYNFRSIFSEKNKTQNKKELQDIQSSTNQLSQQISWKKENK